MPIIYAFSLAIVLLTGFATPVLAISAEDREIYRDAFAAIETGRYDKAQKIAENGGNRLPAKVIRWLVLRKGNKHPDFAALADFIANNPDWPALHELRRRAEEVVDSRVGDERVISWFEKFPPITGMGKLRFAEAQLRRGQTESGEKLLLEAWTTGNFTRQQERAFLRKYRGRLRADDHIARLDRLIWDQRRSEADRMLARVPQEYRYLGRARLMLMGRIGGVDNAIARVPARLIDDPGLVYERARWRRRKGFDERARLLLDPLPEALVRPAAWWREARVQVRDALDVGEVSLAYRLAANHRQLDRQYVAQAEWLAGWIALRFLEDPAIAFQHFSTLFKGVRYPISIARAAYWCGRAAIANGDTSLAKEWFGRAASHTTTYYGQLAAAEIAPREAMSLPPVPVPSQDDVERIEGLEIYKVVRVLAELGQADKIDKFIEKLALMSTTDGERLLAAKTAAEAGRRDLAVKSARRSSWSGVPLVTYGYPLTSISKTRTTINDQALVLAMIRQESGFDSSAISRSGARGLLQLMPATARAVARKLDMTYSRTRLLSDRNYNITLGTGYLAELLDDFDGSYVLALAAYNAGPGRVQGWIRTHGDPRDPSVDVIDWIELIPFEETRNYVQRIVEAVPVYRKLLGSKVFSQTSARLLELGSKAPPS